MKPNGRVRTRMRRSAAAGYTQSMIFLELEKINSKLGGILLLLTKKVGEEEE